jgi:hypothetical protein
MFVCVLCAYYIRVETTYKKKEEKKLNMNSLKLAEWLSSPTPKLYTRMNKKKGTFPFSRVLLD